MKISPENDVIHMQDVYDRIEHLENLYTPGSVDLGLDDNEQAQDDLFRELLALKDVVAQTGKDSSGTLIRGGYFREWVQDYVRSDMHNSLVVWLDPYIDWDAAVAALMNSCPQISFGGGTHFLHDS